MTQHLVLAPVKITLNVKLAAERLKSKSMKNCITTYAAFRITSAKMNI